MKATEFNELEDLLMEARDKYPRDSRDIPSSELAELILSAGYRRLALSDLRDHSEVVAERRATDPEYAAEEARVAEDEKAHTPTKYQGATVARIIGRDRNTSTSMWRCPSCPLILVGPQILGAKKHLEEHGD